MNKTYLILGGNEGDVLNNFKTTNNLLQKHVGGIIQQSAVYKTAAWGNTQQPDYFNQVVLIQTLLKPLELLNEILSIEKTMGRLRGDAKWLPRTIDIDILFYNNEIIDMPQLKVPHPYIQERKFVLVPLNEIAGDVIHPVFNKTVKVLLNKCSDSSDVSLFLGNKQSIV